MSRVVSIPDDAYERVVGTTGKLMEITRQPSSMSEVVALSIEVAQVLFQRLIEDAQRDPTVRETLTRALKHDEYDKVIQLMLGQLHAMPSH